MEFLTDELIKALETAIRGARSRPGIHRVPASDGAAYAYQFNAEVLWYVKSCTDGGSLAKGAVPLKRR